MVQKVEVLWCHCFYWSLPDPPSQNQEPVPPVCSHWTPAASRSGSPRLMSFSRVPRHSTDRSLNQSSASSSEGQSPLTVIKPGPPTPTPSRGPQTRKQKKALQCEERYGNRKSRDRRNLLNRHVFRFGTETGRVLVWGSLCLCLPLQFISGIPADFRFSLLRCAGLQVGTPATISPPPDSTVPTDGLTRRVWSFMAAIT